MEYVQECLSVHMPKRVGVCPTGRCMSKRVGDMSKKLVGIQRGRGYVQEDRGYVKGGRCMYK